MEINSLAFQTDLYFHRFTGIVLEYDGHLVVKNPANPNFFWGNLIFFKDPPDKHSVVNWQRIFHQHFNPTSIQHMTLVWDWKNDENEDKDHDQDHDQEKTDWISLFLNEGFNLEKSLVMIAEDISVPKNINEQVIIRPIQSDLDWEMVIENHVQCRAQHFTEGSYRKFASKRVRDYRLMVQKALGLWMGAFLENGVLVGDLGIFSENGIGRFQAIGTHPNFRRMGVCSTLIYKTYLYTQEKLRISKFVMVADPNYHAFKIYESLGFCTKEIQIGLCRYNKEVWST